ncbi:MAG: hypothetical protein ACKN9D_10885 [Actinomycetales bacterium]
MAGAPEQSPLDALRGEWSEVLMTLERIDRVAWMIWFDARLASFDGNLLVLDFSDPARLDPGQRYPLRDDVRDRDALLLAIQQVTGRQVQLQVQSQMVDVNGDR